MKTANLSALVLPRLKYLVCLLTVGAAVFLIARMPPPQPAADLELKVLRTGLGEGTVTSDALHPGINCGGGGSCTANYPDTESVELTATPAPGGLSRFAGWEGDCSGMGSCRPSMSSARSVRARFDPVPLITEITDFTPAGPTGMAGIRRYLIDHPEVDTAAEFVAALPPEFRQNWILMTRSESLQTGTATSPRILLFSADARYVFTVGMTLHSAYPGSHPDAIEYMQWDPDQKNFRFHEIILGDIPEVRATLSDMTTIVTVPARSRTMTPISIDDAKCPKCHSTRNVPNFVDRTVVPATRGTSPGTDRISPDIFKSKNKPNWDTYDSWGGAMPFNRDRIYQGSVEAAAFRTLLNPWNWSARPDVRAIIEQLELQPPDQLLPGGVTVDLTRSVPRNDVITRVSGGPNDAHIIFPFDVSPPVLVEPSPSPAVPPDPSVTPNYSFDRVRSMAGGSPVIRGGRFVTLHHSETPTLEKVGRCSFSICSAERIAILINCELRTSWRVIGMPRAALRSTRVPSRWQSPAVATGETSQPIT